MPEVLIRLMPQCSKLDIAVKVLLVNVIACCMVIYFDVFNAAEYVICVKRIEDWRR